MHGVPFFLYARHRSSSGHFPVRSQLGCGQWSTFGSSLSGRRPFFVLQPLAVSGPQTEEQRIASSFTTYS